MDERASRRDVLIGSLAATAAVSGSPSFGQQTSGKFRIAVAGDFENVALHAAPWSELGPDVEVVSFNKPMTNSAEIVRSLRPFDAVLLMRERTPMPRAVIEQLPRLKIILFSGEMNATLDHKAAADRHVIVAQAPVRSDDEPPEVAGAGGGGPAELALALLLACAWHIPQADAMIRKGGWAMQPQIPLKIPLAGRVLGIPGYGGIGARMGRYCQSLGMKVLGFSRSLTDEAAKKENAVKADLDTIMRESDVISVHLPLTTQTRGMIGVRELGMVKPGLILINTARGPIVNEPAMIQALRSGRIAMAGFDVYDIEPLPRTHPLLQLPNVVMTPHIGYVSESGMVGRYRAMYQILSDYRKGIVKPYVPNARDMS